MYFSPAQVITSYQSNWIEIFRVRFDSRKILINFYPSEQNVFYTSFQGGILFHFFISRLHLQFASTSDSTTILIEKFFTDWNVRPFFPLCSNHINFRFVIQNFRNLCLKILKVEISIKLVLPWVLALCTCAHLQKSF